MQNKADLPPYAIESVANALRLLALFREQDVVRVTDASKKLGVARSTAHRLLMTLAHEGFVQQERNSRAYRPGPALLEFAFSSAGIQELRQAAQPLMEELSVSLRETVQLLVLEGRSARFIESVECDRPVRVTGRTGSLLPAHATAGGKALLSALAPEEVRRLFPSGLARITDQTNTNMKAFMEELGEIARQGYALNLGESLEGLHAAAVCVTNPAGKVVASLAVSVPSDRGGASRLRQHTVLLMDTAARIRESL
jgi:DNA-binding IclR family transcriptional regulator